MDYFEIRTLGTLVFRNGKGDVEFNIALVIDWETDIQFQHIPLKRNQSVGMEKVYES